MADSYNMENSWANPSTRFMELPFMKKRATQRDSDGNKKEKELPLIGKIPNKIRNHIVAMVGEFCGTFLFLFFAFAGTQIANLAAAATTSSSKGGASLLQAPNTSVLLYIALSFGFSLAVNVWIFFRISGGLFNPAVTLALALIGAITWTRAGLVFIAEMLAAMAVSGVVAAILPGEMAVATTLSTGVSVAQGLFLEMFLTSLLVFTICMLAAEKHKGTFLAPVGIGLALFVAELAGVFWTGGSLNPARSFGPCVALKSFPSYHWIYWLGPVLGSLVAVGLYRFVKIMEYQTANPGADFNEKEDEAFEFDEENAASSHDVERPIPSPDTPSRPLGKSKTSPEEDLSANPSGDGRYFRPEANENVPDLHPGRYYKNGEPGQELHPGYDESYRNSTQIEEGMGNRHLTR